MTDQPTEVQTVVSLRRSLFVGVAAVILLPLGPVGPVGAAVPRQCLGQDVTISGTGEDDRLVGTSGDDVISGGRGWDVVVGRGGDDVLCGGVGSDRVRGGAGQDRMSGGADGTTTQPTTRYGDRLAGGEGDDQITGGGGRGSDSVRFVSASRGVRVDLRAGTATGQGVDTLTGIDAAVGSDFDDVMRTSRVLSLVVGRGGDDRLVGVGDIPYLLGGAGDDRAVLDNGGAVGGVGDDVLLVRPGSRKTYLYGDEGSDLLRARGSGRVIADGGSGADRIVTGSGNDRLSGEGGDDVLDGSGGHRRGGRRKRDGHLHRGGYAEL